MGDFQTMCASDNSTLNFDSSQISKVDFFLQIGMCDPDRRKKYELWEIPNSFELGSHSIGKLLISLV